MTRVHISHCVIVIVLFRKEMERLHSDIAKCREERDRAVDELAVYVFISLILPIISLILPIISLILSISSVYYGDRG